MRFRLKHIILLIVIAVVATSCQQNACKLKTKPKERKYRYKKLKSYQRGAGVGTSRSGDVVTPTAEPEPEEIVEKPIRPEEDIQSIPDTKIGGPPPAEKKTIEFQGQEIDLSEEDYVFEEEILFINLTNLFSDPDKAREQLRELVKLLRENEDIHVTVVGNTASIYPEVGTLYGDSPEVLAQATSLNMRSATIGDVMIARAKRVHRLLIENGVNPNQLDYRTGSHRQYEKDRVVTFILTDKNVKPTDETSMNLTEPKPDDDSVVFKKKSII